MKTHDFHYDLPVDLIAQEPVEPRDSSRLLVLDRSMQAIHHRAFKDVAGYLRTGDLLVFNDTRVIPARLHARRDTGAKVEILLLRKSEDGVWECLVKPGRIKYGESVVISTPAQPIGTPLRAEVRERLEAGSRMVSFSDPALLEKAGEIPLPPYIHAPLADANRYQTVYAKVKGSAAAPTAGLHFTPGLLDDLKKKGVQSTFVTLHIGLDTFRPVREDDPRDHQMHTEYGEVSAEAARIISNAKDEGRRVICVGTTSVRLVEAVAEANGGQMHPFAGQVSLFILPGFQFKIVDALITNFHLPRSSLIMLTCAFAGHDYILSAYREAASLRYRFYTFGDAMLIL
ncbi:MAG: tRNA preQ1(34) S-adenosylmethionine ribosyltransferase-isomerase QueA [Chloroflexi bacterium]|nr:tRNA preQ1(34) S-adenosylmethionine ribosyltransferase-isomerase QueA [Chloroflexota bacterium]